MEVGALVHKPSLAQEISLHSKLMLQRLSKNISVEMLHNILKNLDDKVLVKGDQIGEIELSESELVDVLVEEHGMKLEVAQAAIVANRGAPDIDEYFQWGLDNMSDSDVIESLSDEFL